MKWRCQLVILTATLACGAEPEPVRDPTQEDSEGRARMTVEELPPRPDYPSSRNGQLVAISAGDHEIGGNWEAHAGVCEEAGILELYAGPPGYGTAVLVRMMEGERLGTYSIVAGTEDTAEPPAAYLGVQIFDDPVAFGFQAFAGELELTELGRNTSGRFVSTLREIREDIYTHYVGVFDAIPVEEFSAEYCESFGDSTAVNGADSLGLSDSEEG